MWDAACSVILNIVVYIYFFDYGVAFLFLSTQNPVAA